MAIKAIIWDIGGVLVRTLDRQPRTELAERFGYTYETLEQLVFGGDAGHAAQLGHVSSNQHTAWLCQELGLPAAAGETFMRQFFGGDALDRVLVNAIRAWHGPYKTGIISNGFDDVRSMVHHKWAMADIFDHIVVSGEVGLMKPNPRIFDLAVSGLQIQPGEGVFIDDMPANVDGAQAFGLRAIQFRSTQQVIADIQALLSSK